MHTHNRNIICMFRKVFYSKLCKMEKKKRKKKRTNLTSELQQLQNIMYLVCTADSLQLYMYSKEAGIR